jgi:hypothetical protein
MNTVDPLPAPAVLGWIPLIPVNKSNSKISKRRHKPVLPTDPELYDPHGVLTGSIQASQKPRSGLMIIFILCAVSVFMVHLVRLLVNYFNQ